MDIGMVASARQLAFGPGSPTLLLRRSITRVCRAPGPAGNNKWTLYLGTAERDGPAARSDVNEHMEVRYP
jgi:hypothetical protein